MDVDGKMVWVEEDYFSPHWRWREAVLDRYFTEINGGKKFQMNKLVATRFLAYLRLGNNYAANHYVDLKS